VSGDGRRATAITPAGARTNRHRRQDQPPPPPERRRTRCWLPLPRNAYHYTTRFVSGIRRRATAAHQDHHTTIPRRVQAQLGNSPRLPAPAPRSGPCSRRSRSEARRASWPRRSPTCGDWAWLVRHASRGTSATRRRWQRGALQRQAQRVQGWPLVEPSATFAWRSSASRSPRRSVARRREDSGSRMIPS